MEGLDLPEGVNSEVIATIGSVVLKRFGPALAVIAVLIFITSKIIKRNR